MTLGNLCFKVYLVTGGEHNKKPLTSTEILLPNSPWKEVDNIPSGGPGIKGISMDNRLFMTGKSLIYKIES